MQIHHLAVNALLKGNQVNEMEGGSLFGFEHDMQCGAQFSNEESGFDEAASCAPAFRVLKQLIQRCLTDAVTSVNVYADAILQHLYRWICRFLLVDLLILSHVKLGSLTMFIFFFFLLLFCSPQSKLHDPALHRLLHKA